MHILAFVCDDAYILLDSLSTFNYLVPRESMILIFKTKPAHLGFQAANPSVGGTQKKHWSDSRGEFLRIPEQTRNDTYNVS